MTGIELLVASAFCLAVGVATLGLRAPSGQGDVAPQLVRPRETRARRPR